jgi:23S rRNA pseudouridine1911/1915/1917 synthase
MDSSRILYEDNHLLIINKKPGEIVQGDKTGDTPLTDILKLYIKEKYNKPGDVFLGLVHRIDRPVSGAVIFARTSKALTRMTELVKNREFTKTYLAITDIKPPFEERLLSNYLRKNEAANKSYVVNPGTPGSKLAELTCKHVASGKTLYLLEIDLHTGRHHQIRAQLAAIGLFIRGDVKYGAKRPNKDGSICLHAWKVKFAHPVGGKVVEVVAPLPESPEWEAFSHLTPALSSRRG